MCLLLAYLKFVLRGLSWSLHQMPRVLQLNLFDRRPLVELFTDALATGIPRPADAAVALIMWDSSAAVYSILLLHVVYQPGRLAHR